MGVTQIIPHPEHKIYQFPTENQPQLKPAPKQRDYSPIKCNGVPKAQRVESIRSYNDLILIQNYFKDREQYRDYMMFTSGIALGLRISDFSHLKLSNILDESWNFRDVINIYEQKTGKRSCNLTDNVLITEAVKDSVTEYIEHQKRDMSLDEYLLFSKKEAYDEEVDDYVHRVSKQQAHRILKNAQRALDLPFNIGTHTMRKSFATIAFCLPISATIDMNRITAVQQMLKHNDQTTTMKYIGALSALTNILREGVSDFILGKTDITDLTPGISYNDTNIDNDILDGVKEILTRLREE